MNIIKRMTLLSLPVLLAAALLASLNMLTAQAVTQNRPNIDAHGADTLLSTIDFEANDAAEIAISKTPAIQAIQSGETANFIVTITNTGSIALGNIVVTDTLVPDCNFSMSSMNPGSGTSRTCSKLNVTEGFTNTVVVTAEDLNNPDIKINNSAEAAVVIVNKAIFLPLVIK
jgi:uncharacterized repeat protein (TIGR01451 family)